MKFLRMLLAWALISAGGLTTAIGAGERLQSPRSIGTVRAYQVADPGSSVLALGTGNPSKFSMADSWVTSDRMPSDFCTDIVWFEDDMLSVFGAFYASTSNPVTTMLRMKNDGGTVVFADSFTAAPLPGFFNYTILGVGALPPGNYKIILRFKQGRRVIGQQYLIGVVSRPPCNLDGIVDSGEQCDDGNNDNCDACHNDCTDNTGCGDGEVCAAEQCDDGNQDECGDACHNNCTNNAGCGDGVVCSPEQCDDGNPSPGDGCSPTCQEDLTGTYCGSADCSPLVASRIEFEIVQGQSGLEVHVLCMLGTCALQSCRADSGTAPLESDESFSVVAFCSALSRAFMITGVPRNTSPHSYDVTFSMLGSNCIGDCTGTATQGCAPPACQ